MAIGATGTPQTSTPSAAPAGQGFGTNEETRLFLQLLLTQLQNQNPLDPVDVNEFTSQMVQYASLEQDINANTRLEKIEQELKQFNTINGFSFVGSTAQIKGSTATVEDSGISWNYSLAAPADDVKLIVRDAQGNVVLETTGDLSLGNQTLSIARDALPPTVEKNDALTLTVEAVDDKGQRIDALVTSRVVIDSLVQIDGILRYSSGTLSFIFDDILSLTKPEQILQDVPSEPA